MVPFAIIRGVRYQVNDRHFADQIDVGGGKSYALHTFKTRETDCKLPEDLDPSAIILPVNSKIIEYLSFNKPNVISISPSPSVVENLHKYYEPLPPVLLNNYFGKNCTSTDIRSEQIEWYEDASCSDESADESAATEIAIQNIALKIFILRNVNVHSSVMPEEKEG